MRLKLALSAAVALAALSPDARAAEPWVERPITLPRLNFAFDAGLGIGYVNLPPYLPPGVRGATGVGLNLELGIGITEHLEIGFRQGLRLNDDGRYTQADRYGRMFDTEYFGTEHDAVANPEFRIRGAVLSARVAEIALEGRAYLPVENGSRFGMMFGVPMAFHIGHVVRLDTGAYVPVIFYDPNAFIALSIPFQVWIQATGRFWLGPLTELVVHRGAPAPRAPNEEDVLLGFGLGYQFASFGDFKTWFLFPRINERDPGDLWGIGAGVELRIE
jgi:hypothetical protein